MKITPVISLPDPWKL